VTDAVDREARFRAYIRGETRLESLGAVEIGGGGWRSRRRGLKQSIKIAWESQEPVSADVLLAGLRVVRNDEARLREWASVLLAIGDLSVVSSGPDGDVVLNCLWDLSFGQDTDRTEASLARSLLRLTETGAAEGS